MSVVYRTGLYGDTVAAHRHQGQVPHRLTGVCVMLQYDRGIFSSALGAFLLGVGMSLSGAVSCSHRTRGRLITDPCGLRNADNVYLLDYSRPLHINQVIYLIHKTEHEN